MSKLRRIISYVKKDKRQTFSLFIALFLTLAVLLSASVVGNKQLYKSKAAGEGVNLITNGGFESSTAGAVLSSSSTPWTFTATAKTTKDEDENYLASSETPEVLAATSNLILNPSFSTPTGTIWYSPWVTDIKTGAAATLSKDSSTASQDGTSAKVSVTTASTTDWYVQFAQRNFAISAGKKYTITFSAKASTTRTIPVILQLPLVPQSGKPAYTEVYHQGVNLTTSWQTFNLTFDNTSANTKANISEVDTKLTFSLAAAIGDIWFDNISISEIIPATPTPTVNPSVTSTPKPTATLTPISSPQPTLPGSTSYGLSFDGKDDYVSINDSSVLRPGNGSWTVSLWANPTNTSQTGPLVAKDHPLSPSPVWAMFICGNSNCSTSGKKLNAYFLSDSNNNWRSALTTADVVDGNWHNYTLVADKAADKVRIFVDGTEVSTTLTSVGTWPTISNTDKLRIGSANSANYYSGKIDEVRVFNTALTQTQIQQTLKNEIDPATSNLVGYWKLNEGTGTSTADLTTNHNTGTLTNGPTWITGYIPTSPTPTPAPATQAKVVDASTASTSPFTSYEGKNSLQITIGGNLNTAKLSQLLSGQTISPNTNYTLTFSAYSNITSNDPNRKKQLLVSLTNQDATKNYGLYKFDPIEINSANWTTYSQTFKTLNTTSVNDATLQFVFDTTTSKAGDTYYIDNISLATSPTVNKPANVTTITKKVMLVIFDPIIQADTQVPKRKLHAYMNWGDPRTLSDEVVAYFNTTTGGAVNYQIVTNQIVEYNSAPNAYPIRTTGYQPTEQDYLDCMVRGNCTNLNDGGSMANYNTMLTNSNACTSRNNGTIDEVWLWGAPGFAFYESNMAGPHDYPLNYNIINVNPQGTSCKYLTQIMGMAYHATLGNMIEDFVHRSEGAMNRVMTIGFYGTWGPNQNNIWNRFTSTDGTSTPPHMGGCGTAHISANNSHITSGWPWTTNDQGGNTDMSPVFCQSGLANYPAPTTAAITLNCQIWGCTHEGYYQWWYSHMPVNGQRDSNGLVSNWWGFIFDPWKYIYNNPGLNETSFALTDYLSGYWKMNETSGNTVANSFGTYISRRDYTAGTDATIVDSKTGFGKARHFDGSDFSLSHIRANDAVLKHISNFTVSAWIKYDGGTCRSADLDGYPCGMVSNASYAGNEGFSFYIQRDAGGIYRPVISIGGYKNSNPATTGYQVFKGTSAASAINPNIWYHLVATVDGANLKIFVNGVQEPTTSASAQTITIKEPLASFTIGQFGRTHYTFIGAIDEVAFWTRALSTAEVTRLYNCGNGLDLTQNPLPPACATPPTQPTLSTSAVCSTALRANLNWTVSSGATSYQVERCSNAVGATGCSNFAPLAGANAITGTSYTDNAIAANLTFRYRIRGYSSSTGLYSNYSNTVTITTPNATTLIAPTLSTSAVCVPELQTRLSWAAISGATGYQVERCSNAVGATACNNNYTLLASDNTVTGTSYTDRSVTYNKVYRYRVRACSRDTGKTTCLLSNNSNVTTSTTCAATLTCQQACTNQYPSIFSGNSYCGVLPNSGYPANEGRAPVGDAYCALTRTSYKCSCELNISLTTCQQACTARYGSNYTWTCVASVSSPNVSAPAGDPWCLAQFTSVMPKCGCHL